MKLEELTSMLKVHGIDTDSFGKGGAKTLEHLHGEVEGGEAVLEVEGGQLLRKLRVLNVDVWHHLPDGARLHLIESQQIFKDGRIRKRSLTTSISEKLLANELVQDVVVRAMQEELGITTFEVLGDIVDLPTEKVVSPSFPGLTSEYQVCRCKVLLDESEYKEGGYIEKQKDKDTYFVWVSA
jgi:hypothetical protein